MTLFTKVHIEFHGVQSWLFSVPRLRAMVGANTLLGDMLREELPRLAETSDLWALASIVGDNIPGADPNDPLCAVDDPQNDAESGILARDGGHFEAWFLEGASQFAQEAARLIRLQLPGLRFSITMIVDGQPEVETLSSDDAATLSAELPVFAPCEWSGRGLASAVVTQGTESAEVTRDVWFRHDAARRSFAGDAGDLASLLLQSTKMAQLSRPDTFQELANNGYLAVIFADGNGVGAAAPEQPGQRTRFYHQNRVLLRRALKNTLDELADSVENGSPAPVSILMLGGDDLLMACQAPVALPLVTRLCYHLQQLQKSRLPTDFYLTLGIGVVISQHTVPFFRLHAVAETLAGSAKRKFRGLSPQSAESVVDWATYTATGLEDPVEVRRRDWIRHSESGTCVLSKRPYIVVGETRDTLETLLGKAAHLRHAPRSQLHYLTEQLGMGKTVAELTFAELSPQTVGALKAASIRSVWERTAESAEGGPYLTSILDMFEVLEITNLAAGRHGKTAKKPESEKPTQSQPIRSL